MKNEESKDKSFGCNSSILRQRCGLTTAGNEAHRSPVGWGRELET